MRKYRKVPNVFLSPSEINNMQDDDVICVNHTAICSRLAILYMAGSKDKEAMSILLKVDNEILEKEIKCKSLLWGGKMTVGEVKTAFKDLNQMRRTAFRKIV